MEKHIYRDVNFRGTIKRIEDSSVNSDNEQIEKYANVYLPYGYDSADSEKRYNILYLMHGGGGSPDAWLDCSWVKNMLDCSIHSGKVEPLIVVFPTYYNEINPVVEMGKIDTERQRILFFQKELVHNLIPAVESQFHTYADTVTEDG